MPRFKVTETSFIRDQIYQAGEEVEFTGEPGSNLEPLDDDAKALVTAAEARSDAKASAIAAGVGGQVNAEFAGQVTALVDQVAAANAALAGLAARLATLESSPAAAAADLTAYAKASDVSELDAGMNIMTGRISAIEGTLDALAKAAPVAPTP